MSIRRKLLEVLSPRDERKELDHQIRLREMRLEKADEDRERLKRLQEMIEVKVGGGRE